MDSLCPFVFCVFVVRSLNMRYTLLNFEVRTMINYRPCVIQISRTYSSPITVALLLLNSKSPFSPLPIP